VDAQSDIYAAGLIFYELLTGKVPFPADSALQSLMKRTQERAVPVSQVDNSVPKVLSGICQPLFGTGPSQSLPERSRTA
jgi:eukaryotic-like serine/threonine-protein kinase